jgi:hypothetical protein
MRYFSGFLTLFLFLSACATGPDAQAIVDRAIRTHGGQVLRSAVVEFDFRDRSFRATRDGGIYRYERMFADTSGRIHDIMTNDSLYREVDGVRVPLTDAQRRSIESGVNSVIYFALLPFNLNDPAVRKQYLEEAVVEGEPYHKIEVTFDQEGGGRGYEDRFVYWIHRDRYTMDYLAYRFYEDQGGTRFRRAVNPRVIGGVLFADYENFTADTLEEAIEGYDEILEAGALRLVSRIDLENIRVRR